MRKLLKFRQWLTVEEAAVHLSDTASEPVSEADVLRLALDGHLTLSVNFVNHTEAHLGSISLIEETDIIEVPSIDGDYLIKILTGLDIGDGRLVKFSPEVVVIDGIWDLTMLGVERSGVEHRFQQLTGGPSVEPYSSSGVLVRNNEEFAKLVSHFDDKNVNNSEPDRRYADPRDWYPADRLPDDAPYVVRLRTH